MNKALTNQDYMYTIMTKPSKGLFEVSLVASIIDHIDGYNFPERVYQALTNDLVKIISLTITEGGYNIDSNTGKFDYNNHEIKNDIDLFIHHKNTHPSTIFGFLFIGLRNRKNNQQKGVTILSCDNIEHNGNIAKSMLLSFVNEIDKDLV
eukprot:GHVR01080546.1.p1 GENE.GHVR01080546.1~~GHVR01080546.1.p1  ORF type:complete len:150 (-),score=14.64 GHVR01080546.1:788-1237(-)